MADGKIRCSLSNVTIEDARKTALLGGAVDLCFFGRMYARKCIWYMCGSNAWGEYFHIRGIENQTTGNTREPNPHVYRVKNQYRTNEQPLILG